MYLDKATGIFITPEGAALGFIVRSFTAHGNRLNLDGIFDESVLDSIPLEKFYGVCVSRILKSGPCTHVFWQDGTKTTVRRSPDEPDNDYAAFTAALAIKLYGSNSALKRMLKDKIEVQKPKEKKSAECTDTCPIDFEAIDRKLKVQNNAT